MWRPKSIVFLNKFARSSVGWTLGKTFIPTTFEYTWFCSTNLHYYAKILKLALWTTFFRLQPYLHQMRGNKQKVKMKFFLTKKLFPENKVSFLMVVILWFVKSRNKRKNINNFKWFMCLSNSQWSKAKIRININ